MIDSSSLERLDRLVTEERALSDLATLARGPEWADVRLDEIRASCALAGVAMTRAEIEALVRRGLAGGSRQLRDFILVADYADAAAMVAGATLAGSRRRHITAAEIVELHARALRRVPLARPGEWRRTTVPAFASGMVAPPAWLVPRDIAAYVERVGAGPRPDESTFLWIAAAHERFVRIQPFALGNGRVGRLVVNLLLRRVGLPPFIIAAAQRRAYVAALRSADARDHVPLARLLARSVLATVRRLRAAAERREDLVPLAELALPQEREALYKAGQRGRLHTVRRGGTILTTRAAIEAYRASRAPSGRRP